MKIGVQGFDSDHNQDLFGLFICWPFDRDSRLRNAPGTGLFRLFKIFWRGVLSRFGSKSGRFCPFDPEAHRSNFAPNLRLLDLSSYRRKFGGQIWLKTRNFSTFILFDKEFQDRYGSKKTFCDLLVFRQRCSGVRFATKSRHTRPLSFRPGGSEVGFGSKSWLFYIDLFPKG